MDGRNVSVRRRAIALALGLAVPLAGCHTWGTVDGSPAGIVADRDPDRVLVTLANGAVLDLRHPRVEGDSLVGTVASGARAERGAVALADVRGVQVRKTNVSGTVLLAALGTYVASGIVYCLTTDDWTC